MLSPTSWERRRAWLRQSRHWQTQVLEEEAAAALQNVPDAEPSGLDDVFQEGNPINKIEDWLQDCGYSEEGFFEEAGQLNYNGCPSHGTSFEDDLSLGAEATLLAASSKLYSSIDPCRSFLETSRPGQLLDLGCSLASSSMTGGTNKTSSSISEILDKVQEDAEDVLFSLGFGQEDHKDTSRIPARFFTTPSQAKGIDFQLFLKSQVRRIEMEDPCLMLASLSKCRHWPSLQMPSSVSTPTCLRHLSKSSHHPTCSGIATQLMCHPSRFCPQSLNLTHPESASGKPYPKCACTHAHEIGYHHPTILPKETV